MRKEILIEKKKKIAETALWQLRNVITEDELREFSQNQLKIMVSLFEKAEIYRENKSPFYTLSATEVIQKESGKIAFFDSETIREESREECLSGASGPAYEQWERERA